MGSGSICLVGDVWIFFSPREIWHWDSVLFLLLAVSGVAEFGDISHHLSAGFAPHLAHQIQDHQQQLRTPSIQSRG